MLTMFILEKPCCIQHFLYLVAVFVLGMRCESVRYISRFILGQRQVCNVPRTNSDGFHGNAHHLQSALLSSLPVSSSCKGKITWNDGMSRVYVVDIFNNTG